MTEPHSPSLCLRNANLFDSRSGQLVPGRSVLIAGDSIAEVGDSSLDAAGAEVIDLEGRTLLPGLIDAHVHVTITTLDPQRDIQPASLTTAEAKGVLEGMLARGFTTVRDAAGADFGLHLAVERGLFEGPRLFIAGRALSQTGGHGDPRPRFEPRDLPSCCTVGRVGVIADGVDAVRKATREEIRRGAHHVKIMAGGGVASPNDPLEGLQYSSDEIAAICEEARAARTYTMAHAYTPEAVQRAARFGVRSIEHGNLIDAETARLMAEHGTYLVPTLVTYDSLHRLVAGGAWNERMVQKLEMVLAAGVEAIRLARSAGVRLGFGTDLLAHMHTDQSQEFTLRARVESPAEVLRSATFVNAEIMGQSGRLGIVAPGAFADVVAVDGNPLENIALLEGQGEHLALIVKGGRIHKNTLVPASAQTRQEIPA